jgi:hypothetical protein
VRGTGWLTVNDGQSLLNAAIARAGHRLSAQLSSTPTRCVRGWSRMRSPTCRARCWASTRLSARPLHPAQGARLHRLPRSTPRPAGWLRALSSVLLEAGGQDSRSLRLDLGRGLAPRDCRSDRRARQAARARLTAIFASRDPSVSVWPTRTIRRRRILGQICGQAPQGFRSGPLPAKAEAPVAKLSPRPVTAHDVSQARDQLPIGLDVGALDGAGRSGGSRM